MRASSDLLVVGGGPAGLATAITARGAGLDVLVVDRARPPIDKACGEGIMPDGLERLQALGVELDPARLFPFRGIRYVDGEVVAEGTFPGVHGAGVRRLDLHTAMVQRAEAVGVRFAWGTRVMQLAEGRVVSESGELRAGWIVAADGLRSALREAAGLDGRPVRQRRFGVRRHFALSPWSDRVEVHWGEGYEAYVTPVAREEVGVAFLWSGRKAGFDELLAGFPALAARLAGIAVISRDRGMGPLGQRVRGVVRGRLALVGDAAGYVDAITGEGLSLAFHQAEAVVAAICAGDLRRYQRAWRRIGALPDGLTRLMLAVERRPWLRRRMIRAFAGDPELFSKILAVHCRARPLSSFVWTGTPRLLWRLVGS